LSALKHRTNYKKKCANALYALSVAGRRFGEVSDRRGLVVLGVVVRKEDVKHTQGDQKQRKVHDGAQGNLTVHLLCYVLYVCCIIAVESVYG